MLMTRLAYTHFESNTGPKWSKYKFWVSIPTKITRERIYGNICTNLATQDIQDHPVLVIISEYCKLNKTIPIRLINFYQYLYYCYCFQYYLSNQATHIIICAYASSVTLTKISAIVLARYKQQVLQITNCKANKVQQHNKVDYIQSIQLTPVIVTPSGSRKYVTITGV